MARTSKAVTDHKIEEFAEDLGRLLGSATAKAEHWLGQREHIVKRLTQVRDTASTLLNKLGHQAQGVVTVGTQIITAKRLGRQPGSKRGLTVAASAPAGAGPRVIKRKRRTLSAKARKAISMAQKARWARHRKSSK